MKISGKAVGWSILIISIVLAAVFVFLAVLRAMNRIQIGTIPDFIIIALLLISGPYPFYMHAKAKKIDKIEERLSDLLRDLAESGRFGMTLADAIKKAAKGDYGKLTPEIKRMSAQIAWGVPANEALESFAKRVNTPLVNRAMAIVMKASKAGGDVSDVLTVAANNTKDIQLLNEERKMEMSSYIAVIYTAFFVFLAVIVILNAVFLPAMAGATASQQAPAGGAGGGVSGGMAAAQKPKINLDEIKLIYLGGAIVQGIGDGILAGIIDTGRIYSGLRHSFIMVLLGALIIRVLVV